jgi:hypothetical protein
MAGHGDKLSRKQEQAIAALLTETTIAKAALKVKVGYRTLKGWLIQPAFRTAYRDARRELVDGALKLLQRAAEVAVKTLVNNLKAPRPVEQIRAALGILEHVQGLQVSDLAEQLAELKEEIEALNHDRGNHDPRSGPPTGTSPQDEASPVRPVSERESNLSHP